MCCSSPFIDIPHYYLLPFTTIPCLSLPFLAFHCHSLPFTTIPCLALPFLAFHYHSLPFTTILCLSQLFLTFHYHSLPFSIIPCFSHIYLIFTVIANILFQSQILLQCTRYFYPSSAFPLNQQPTSLTAIEQLF